MIAGAVFQFKKNCTAHRRIVDRGNFILIWRHYSASERIKGFDFILRTCVFKQYLLVKQYLLLFSVVRTHLMIYRMSIDLAALCNCKQAGIEIF